MTGGAIGMGRGIALVLAEEGYDIAFSYYREKEETLAATTAMLKERGAQAWHFQADLSKPGGSKELFDKAVDSLGGLILPGMPEDSSMAASNKGW